MKHIVMCVLVAASLSAKELVQWNMWTGASLLTLGGTVGSSASSSDDLTIESDRSSNTTPPLAAAQLVEIEQQTKHLNMLSTCEDPTPGCIFRALGGVAKHEMIEDENGCAYPSPGSIILWKNVQIQIYALAQFDQASLMKVWDNLQKINALSPYEAANVYGDGKQYYPAAFRVAVQNEFQLVLSKLAVGKLLISKKGQHQYRSHYNALLDEAKTWCGYAQFANFSGSDIFEMCHDLARQVLSLDAIAPLNECLRISQKDRSIASNRRGSVLRSLASSHANILKLGSCKYHDRGYHAIAGFLAASCLDDCGERKRIQDVILFYAKQFPLSSLSKVADHLTQEQQVMIAFCAHQLEYKVPGSTSGGWVVTSSCRR